jgi:alkylation response protein AidB-like acyl-CoA dehydrogenase
MNFWLTNEQADIQKAARAFVQGEFDPDIALQMERRGEFPLELWKKACKLGFIGLHFPEEHGGQGFGLIENLLVVEEFCSQHSGIGIALGLCTYGSEMILRFGKDDQKQRYIVPMTEGTYTCSLAFLERNPGGAFTSIETTATRCSGGYLINGNKSFVMNGALPGPMIVLCQLKNSIGEGEQVAVIAEKGIDRISCGGTGGRVGMRMVPMSEVGLVDCEVPRENILGDEGRGQHQLLSTLNQGNLLAAAMGIGIAQGAFNLALAYAKRREQFGQKIGSFEAIRDRLADMATRIEVSRSLTYRAASDYDGIGKDRKIGYMAKMVSAENALEVSKDSVHILGGYGYMVEHRVEQFYRDAAMLDMIGTVGGVEKGYIADQVIGRL